MKWAEQFLNHGTVILSLMFLVFLILDRFNPLMNFVKNDISSVLLALLCTSVIARSVLAWRKT